MPQQAQFVIPPPLCVVTARLNVIFAKLHNAFFFFNLGNRTTIFDVFHLFGL